MPTMILALDPGRTTGFARAVINGDVVQIGYGEKKFDHGEFYDFLLNRRYDRIVCESFEYRRQDDVDLFPCELIGVLNLYRDMYEGTTGIVSFQKPKQAVGKKAAYNDDVLKSMGLHHASAHHGRDACRHLLVFLNHGSGYQYMVQIKKPKFILEQAVWESQY